MPTKGGILKDKLKACGVYHIEQWQDGKLIKKERINNVVVQNFFTAVYNCLADVTPMDLSITHLATGDGTATAARTDTALGNELFRKAISTVTGGTTNFTAKTSLMPDESNFTIREIGLFSDTTLISRVNVNIAKNENVQLLVTYTLEII